MYQDRIITLCLDGYAVGVNPLDGYAALDTFNSAPIPVGPWKGYSILVKCPSTGSPAGTVKLQGCNDAERVSGVPDALLVNWFDIDAGAPRIVSQSISNATTVHLTDPECMYRWVRIKYTRTSGTITITSKIQRKTTRG